MSSVFLVPGRAFRPLLLLVLFGVGTEVRAQSLSDIYELALQNDPQLKANLAGYRAQHAAAGVARSAIFPQLQAAGEYTDSQQEQVSRRQFKFDTPSADDPVIFDSSNEGDVESERTVYSVRLEQSLVSFPDWFGFRRAGKLRRRADALLAAEHQQLVLRVSDAYFSVLRAGEDLRSARAEEAAIARQLALTRNRFETGIGAAADVLEARATRDLAHADRLSREEALATARERLGAITGVPHEVLWQLRDDFPITLPEPADEEVWTRFALENNYSLRAAELAAEAAKFALRARRSAHLPALRGRATYSDWDSEGESFALPFAEESEDTVWSLNLELPLFTGGRLHSERRQAYHEYVQARENFVRRKRDVLQQVRSLYQTLEIGVVRTQAHRRAVLSAQSALQSIRNGYEAGTRDIVDVLNAERNLYRSRRDNVHARLDYLLDSLRLKEQTGQLRKEEVQRINQWLRPPAGGTSLREHRDSARIPPVEDGSSLSGRVSAAQLAAHAAAYTLQLAAFPGEQAVQKFFREHDLPGMFYVRAQDSEQRTLYRVCYGIFATLSAGRAVREQLPVPFRHTAWLRPVRTLDGTQQGEPSE